MVGTKLPSTHSRAIALMQYNIYRGSIKKKIKKQARKEYRRYLSSLLHSMVSYATMHQEVNMDKFYSISNFPIPSVWLAADGGTYGYIATGIDTTRDDILVDEFTDYVEGLPLKATGVKRSIDYFKIQYRYYQVQ
jgi:hypothetical protein